MLYYYYYYVIIIVAKRLDGSKLHLVWK